MLRDIFFYLKKSVTFFDLQVKSIAPVIFIVTLGINLIYALSDNGAKMDISGLIIGLAVSLFINMISLIYLYAAIKEAKNEPYTAWDCLRETGRNFFKLLVMSVLKVVLVSVGILLYVVPGIIVAIMFLFSECIVLDSGKPVNESMKQSKAMTSGKKLTLFRIILFCDAVIFFFIVLLLSMFASNNDAIFAYACMFLVAIYSLMQNKRLAYLYVDVEYGKEEDR